MPLRPDLRNLRDQNGDLVYRGPAWKARRERLLKRAENRCEQCRVPNHAAVWRNGGWWRDEGWYGRTEHGEIGCARGSFLVTRFVHKIVLTMAHLTHNPLENDDADLAMLCQWCHLNYDKLHHRDTRAARKDAARPLLAGVA